MTTTPAQRAFPLDKLLTLGDARPTWVLLGGTSRQSQAGRSGYARPARLVETWEQADTPGLLALLRIGRYA
jgi:hypothetical protein